MHTPREPKQLSLDLSRRGESPEDIRAWSPEDIRAWAHAVTDRIMRQRRRARRSHLDEAADAGFDTWEEYRGER